MNLLLDSNMHRSVVDGLRRADVEAHHLAEWRGGALLHAPDTDILVAAGASSLTLVTRDRRMRGLLTRFWQSGRSHGGLVIVESRLFADDDVGAVVRALHRLVVEAGEWDWTDRTVTLRPVRD